MSTTIILSREFRDNQKKYFDLIDNNEEVIIKRRNGKAYTIVPITATEVYFLDPQIKARLERSIAQAKAGEVKELTLKRQIELLGEWLIKLSWPQRPKQI